MSHKTEENSSNETMNKGKDITGFVLFICYQHDRTPRYTTNKHIWNYFFYSLASMENIQNALSLSKNKT